MEPDCFAAFALASPFCAWTLLRWACSRHAGLAKRLSSLPCSAKLCWKSPHFLSWITCSRSTGLPMPRWLPKSFYPLPQLSCCAVFSNSLKRKLPRRKPDFICRFSCFCFRQRPHEGSHIKPVCAGTPERLPAEAEPPAPRREQTEPV